MHWINWVIVAVYLAVVILDGLRRTRGTKTIEGYFLASRSLPWWAVGLSVMATQLSAITLIGTTGQGATDGLRCVQFYKDGATFGEAPIDIEQEFSVISDDDVL